MRGVVRPVAPPRDGRGDEPGRSGDGGNHYFLCPPLPGAYSLVNVHLHRKVVLGEDLGVVVEAAVGTDVELWAPGQ